MSKYDQAVQHDDFKVFSRPPSSWTHGHDVDDKETSCRTLYCRGVEYNPRQNRRSRLWLVLVSCLVVSTTYFLLEITCSDSYQYVTSKFFHAISSKKEEFLVRSAKCRILARDARDSSILPFVEREKFVGCTTTPLLTRIERKSNGTASILKIDENAAKYYPELSCCWASVHRLNVTTPPLHDIDSLVKVDWCTHMEREVDLPEDVEVVLVKCNNTEDQPIYSNVHHVIALKKLRREIKRLNSTKDERKLSVLILGIDTVSRLNFKRTMPGTESYLRKTGWTELQGYNKMSENTFPNLMAILTGLKHSDGYKQCAPTVSYGLDKCPLIWHHFRNTSYVTAYGEDTTDTGTFNHLKVGFVDPPTDYYLRPYMTAAEQLLPMTTQSKSRYYCTGPVMSPERIFNYAEDFAQTFIGTPYFGFFWTNSWSHEDLNGLSAVDDRMLSMFRRLELGGVLNDSMVIFLSDHGARYGPIRETFQGWYEDRLPFLYVWLPEWFRTRDEGAAEALRTNANRLASPFDLHETLRDVLTRAGGEVVPAKGCPRCQSLFRPIAVNRSCEDAGVTPHWCACTVFKPVSTEDAAAVGGVHKFVHYVNDVIDKYKNGTGERLCASLSLKRILRVEESVDVAMTSVGSKTREFLCLLEVTPGDGMFEVTIRSEADGNYTISESEISRINVYGDTADCLTTGNKNYCHCL